MQTVVKFLWLWPSKFTEKRVGPVWVLYALWVERPYDWLVVFQKTNKAVNGYAYVRVYEKDSVASLLARDLHCSITPVRDIGTLHI